MTTWMENLPAHAELRSDAEKLNQEGVELSRSGRHLEALVHYDRAIALFPDLAVAHNNRANSLDDLGHFDEAVISYDRAIAIEPTYANAYWHKFQTLRKVGRFEDAAATIGEAVGKDLARLDWEIARARLLIVQGEHDQAFGLADRFVGYNARFDLGYDPGLIQHVGHLIRQYILDGHYADDRPRMDVRYAGMFYYCGRVLYARHGYADAETWLARTLLADPQFHEAHYSHGLALTAAGRHHEAMLSYARARQVGCKEPFLMSDLLHAKLMISDWSDYAELRSEIVEKLRGGFASTTPFYLSAHSSSAEDLKKCAELRCAQRYGRQLQSSAPWPYRHGGQVKTPRVAILSEGLRTHPIAQLAVGVFEHLQRGAGEYYAVSLRDAGPGDAVRERLRQAFGERFVEASGWRDADVAAWLTLQNIDILIDLDGHTDAGRALNIASHRVAPVQMTWLGYPGTTGASFIDYILADSYIIPEGAEGGYSEKVVRLPNCYQPNDASRALSACPSRAELGIPSDSFVFCCFNNSYKILPDMLDIWARILHRVGGSVLWLFETSPDQANNLRGEMRNRGVAPSRIVFAPRVSPDEHLARHAAADLYVDAFPYNAHTSAAEALWAGLPLVTLSGETFASRVAGSLLNAIGLPELITTTAGAYEDLIVELATQPNRLAALRTKLANNRLTMPLFDTEGFARDFENILIALHRRQSSSHMEET